VGEHVTAILSYKMLKPTKAFSYSLSCLGEPEGRAVKGEFIL